MKIRPVKATDVHALVEIYNHYIKHSTATFEEEAVSEEIFLARINKVEHVGLPWLVCERDGVVVGYAYAGRWNERSAYRFTVESSIYVAHNMAGKGVATALYSALLTSLKSLGIKHVLGVVTLPNPASCALHQRFGFKQVGEFASVGYKFDKWLSVSYWQLQL